MVEQGVIPFFINVVLNGVITWLVFGTQGLVPMWGLGNVGFDLLLTGFMLPFATCMIVSRVIAGQLRSGKVALLPKDQVPETGPAHQPIWLRAIGLGGLGVLLASAPVVAALALADVTGFAATAFIAFKAGWGGILGAVVSPWIAWWALASASHDAIPAGAAVSNT